MLWLLLGYMFLFIDRPFEIWKWLGEFHIERLYMAVTLVAVAFWPGKRWTRNRLHLAYAGFALAVLVSWMASPWGPACEATVENYFKMLVFYGLMIAVVHGERDLKRLLTGMLVIFFLYLTHSLREFIGGRHDFRMGISRMIGVDSTMGDPNSFGLSIVYTLPFVPVLWAAYRARWARAFLAAYTALALVCIALTGSRSSFVGVVICSGLIAWRSPWRWRMLVGLVVAAPLLWLAMPGYLQNRFETILFPEVGPANAQTSAQGRIDGLFIGLELWGKYPATGVGPGAWRPASGSPLESHNVYGQVVGELGTLGLLAFAGIVVGIWLNARWVRKTYRSHPEWDPDLPYCVAQAVGMTLFLLLLEGNLGHNLFRYNWLWIGAFVVIARQCVEERLAAATARSYPAWAAAPADAAPPRPEFTATPS